MNRPTIVPLVAGAAPLSSEDLELEARGRRRVGELLAVATMTAPELELEALRREALEAREAASFAFRHVATPANPLGYSRADLVFLVDEQIQAELHHILQMLTNVEIAQLTYSGQKLREARDIQLH